MSLACSFRDWIRFSRKKSYLFWVDPSPYAGFRLLPCHYTMKEGERGPFFPKLRVRIKDNNSSPHGKFSRFLFPFSCKFPDLNFASYVLYIFLCGTHSEPGLPVASYANFWQRILNYKSIFHWKLVKISIFDGSFRQKDATLSEI